MRMQRTALALLCSGFLATSLPWTPKAVAASPTSSDLTDFVTRLGGYFFVLPAPEHKYDWEQMSYKATSGSTSSSPSSGSANSSSTAATGSSNVTTIIMTKFPTDSINTGSGTANEPPASETTIPPYSTSLSPCAADNYFIDTVTLDLRDLLGATAVVTSASEGKNPIWQVVLKKRSGSFIRINKQKLPANCVSKGVTADSSETQVDLDNYAIDFYKAEEATQFQNLVNNVIATLTPPTLATIRPPL